MPIFLDYHQLEGFTIDEIRKESTQLRKRVTQLITDFKGRFVAKRTMNLMGYANTCFSLSA